MRTTIKVCISLLVFAVLFTSCPDSNTVPQSVTVSYNNLQTTPNVGGKYYPIQTGTTEVIIKNLPVGKKVKLVRMNPSPTACYVSPVTFTAYSRSANESRSSYETEFAYIENDSLSYNYVDYAGSDDGFFEIPFIDTTDYAKLEREYKEKHSSRMVEPNLMVAGGQSFSEGATKAFKVTKVIVVDEDEEEEVEIEIHATLRAEGQHCYVWVSDGEIVDDQGNYSNTGKFGNFDITSATTNNDNKISLDQAEDLAEAFDSLYEIETNLIGDSYNTNPDTSLFINPQAKISILVYDIGGDYTATQNAGTFGMFWGGDLYKTSAQDGSNEMELLYVDSYFTDRVFTSVISTVAHEFEHMLYFVNKWIEQGIKTGATWYTEMGAMMAEDCLATYLNDQYDSFVISSDSTLGRLKNFNISYYSGGLGYWGSGDDVYTSYAISGIFGCWLQRNYGGKDLISYIVNNNATNETSITKAIQSCGSSDTFIDAFRKFALSFAQPNATAFTLKKSTTADANGHYGLVTADPWNEIYNNTVPTQNGSLTIRGPAYLIEGYSGIMRGYGFWMTGWNNTSSNGVRIQLNSPGEEENYIVITD